MRNANILKGEERMNHYLPLAQAIFEGIGAGKEWVKESGWDREIAHCLDEMEREAHDYAGDMECGEVKDREDVLADIFDGYLYSALYVNEKTEVTPMIVWEYDDDLLLVGIPKYSQCTLCKYKYKCICGQDISCAKPYGKLLVLTAEDTEPKAWPDSKEDWEIAEAVGIFQKVPKHWELMYKEALDK